MHGGVRGIGSSRSVYVAVISVVAGVVGVMARPASKHTHITSICLRFFNYFVRQKKAKAIIFIKYLHALIMIYSFLCKENGVNIM